MANNDRQETQNKISVATYGIGNRLNNDSTKLSDIVKQTALEVATKFGKRVDNKVIDNYTTLNLSALFDQSPKRTTTNKTNDNKEYITTTSDFKELMQDNASSAVNLLTAENGRIMNYSNYESIANNITECALALDTYVSNILSPDDYSKSIFNIEFKSHDNADKEKVTKQLKDITKKYHLEEKTEEIVTKALTYGDCFVSVLPYDKEIAKYLMNTSANGILNENASPEVAKLFESFKIAERTFSQTLDENFFNESLLTEDETHVLEEAFGTDYQKAFSSMINDNVKIRSVTELLKNRAEADSDVLFSKADVEIKDDSKKSKKKSKTEDVVKINGSVIKILEPERMVALDVDGVCYGYYYIEPGAFGVQNTPYNANSAKAYAQTANPMNPSLQPQTPGNPGEAVGNPVAKNLDISDEKLNLISSVMLKALGKKLNKKYIDENKQFKDLLFNLLKQRYLFEKGISITYFLPEEIVHFKVSSIFEKIVFFAKIYLAILTNMVIVKLGRGHDKRIYYVNAGVDNNHEQAIMKVIQDVKTKEFKMSNLGSISSILSLNPGAFDDIYMPQINGEKPVDIEILQGMDQEINNDFIDFLRRSMIQGTGLPQALLEAADNIEFARQISAQNANFCRRVVRYQKQFTPEFETLVRLLYKYEYQYTLDQSDNLNNIDINDITVAFPSPGTLNLSNMIEQFTQVDSLADYITKRYIPDRADQSNIDEQASFKGRIIEDKLPQIDWQHYSELYKQHTDEFKKENLIANSNKPTEEEDPYSGGGY